MAVHDPTWPNPIWFQNFSKYGAGQSPHGICLPVCWEGYAAILAVPACQLGGMWLLISRIDLWWVALLIVLFGSGLMLFAFAVRTDYRSVSERKSAHESHEHRAKSVISD